MGRRSMPHRACTSCPRNPACQPPHVVSQGSHAAKDRSGSTRTRHLQKRVCLVKGAGQFGQRGHRQGGKAWRKPSRCSLSTAKASLHIDDIPSAQLAWARDWAHHTCGVQLLIWSLRLGRDDGGGLRCVWQAQTQPLAIEVANISELRVD